MIVKVQLIRHGKTHGNLEKRYIGGKTDESLCTEGIEELKELRLNNLYFKSDAVFSSPMKRCLETANIIFENKDLYVVENLREINFGIFEGKTHKELSENKFYQQWIDSCGKGNIPDGENMEIFSSRVVSAFRKIISEKRYKIISAVVHGGVIMAILSTLTCGNYYDFMCNNGHGYIFDLSTDDFYISNLRKI